MTSSARPSMPPVVVGDVAEVERAEFTFWRVLSMPGPLPGKQPRRRRRCASPQIRTLFFDAHSCSRGGRRRERRQAAFPTERPS